MLQIEYEYIIRVKLRNPKTAETKGLMNFVYKNNKSNNTTVCVCGFRKKPTNTATVWQELTEYLPRVQFARFEAILHPLENEQTRVDLFQVT